MKICVVVGYFDRFSGYQEVGLVRALARHHDVTVVSGNVVSPIFSDQHLERIEHSRRYEVGKAAEDGYSVIRLRSTEFRSMVYARRVSATILGVEPDLIIVVMPGQFLPALAFRAMKDVPSVVLFGDNRAMWASLPRWKQLIKFALFAVSKGPLYLLSTRHAEVAYGYTPNTLRRLRSFVSSKRFEVLPLAFDPSNFGVKEVERDRVRKLYGIASNAKVLLLVGKYNRQKRFEEAIEGFRRVRRGDDEVALFVVGPSPEDLSSVGTAEEFALDSIHLIPFASQSALNSIFNAADVGMWPAMPAITIQQAMGTGLYVVLPDNDLVSHLVAGPEAGVLVSGLEGMSSSDLADQISVAFATVTPDRQGRALGNEWLSSVSLAARISGVGGA